MNHNRTDKENKTNNVNLKGIEGKLLTAKGTHIANELVLSCKTVMAIFLET